MRPINKILFVTLTNIGDVILTLPALDLLRRHFPAAQITVVAGPRAEGLFTNNPSIAHFLSFDKHAPLSSKVRFFRQLQAEKFDLVVDLRNSLFGLLLGKVKPGFIHAPSRKTHASSHHCAKLQSLCKNEGAIPAKGGLIFISSSDKEYIAGLLSSGGIKNKERFIVISPGARSHTKRWPPEQFCELAGILAKEAGYQVVLVGDEDDRKITGFIASTMRGAVDLAGKTTLPQLAELLSRSAVLVTNDSANLHLAGYLNVPTVGIFGPTDERRYGPWSSHCRVVKADTDCRPCMKAQCVDSLLSCLTSITVAEVKEAVLQVLREASEDSQNK
jgi:ADP-heptose:LPS heptosyltransferase